ncbi:MAG: outer membrane beta-barrel protein, partial [Bacteroidales bacterium]|nr:outer membrane beta-barrel protein [Bacteroidales bacterium]
DQSTALNNLPAAVVDKIRVIDRESEQTRASGLQDGNREKVLDVGLKKEYEKGWFGNVGLKGGTTAGSPEGEDPLRDNRGFLYNGNALVSAYSEKDQVTVIGNVQNVSDSDIVVMVSMGGDDEVFSSLDQGLTTAAQLGVNANTSRIKDVETTVSVNYKYTDSDTGTRADRTTYQQDGNLASRTENTGKQYANSVNADVELQKETGKVWFHVRPGFRYGRTNSFGGSSSETRREGNLMNRSDNTTRSLSDSKDAEVSADVTFREVGGKTGRTIGLSGGTSYGKTGGESSENTSLTLSDNQDVRTMTYLTDGGSSTLNGRLQYTEPLGKKWTLSTSANYTWSRRNRTRDAFDPAGRNDYYSSISRSNYLTQQYDVTAQYKFGTGSWITVGARAIGSLNETFSKSYGIEETTGKDQWYWYVAPSLNFQYNKGMDRLNIYSSAFSQRPSADRMLPVLNIANPSRLTLGNVYLKPYSYSSFSANWTRNNREKFSTVMAYFSGQVNAKPITQA